MTPDQEQVFQEELKKINDAADNLAFVLVHTKNLYKTLKDIQNKLLKIPIEIQRNPQKGLEEIKDIITQIQNLLESSKQVTENMVDTYKTVSNIKEH